MFSKSVFALAAFVTITITPIAHALMSGGGDTSEGALLANGYYCSADDSGFDICTKSGEPSYSCDEYGNCTQMLRRNPRPKLSVAPSAGLAVSNPSTISNPRATVLVPIRALVK